MKRLNPMKLVGVALLGFVVGLIWRQVSIGNTIRQLPASLRESVYPQAAPGSEILIFVSTLVLLAALV